MATMGREVITNEMTLKNKLIAVIGAGPSGLPAIKSCIEEGLNVVCFEKTGYIGGLWHYHEDPSNPSVLQSTVINSSKEVSAYSDFPPPKDFALYPHHTQMLQYFEMYAVRFDLYQYVRYYTTVTKVEPNIDYSSTGKWLVSVHDTAKDVRYDEVFDGVMVCSGHHTYPRIPTFENQLSFKGEIIHTQMLKTSEKCAGKSVLVVGIGNSGADSAVEVSNCANKVYLSTRTGAWILSKVGFKGWPYDFMYLTRIVDLIMKIFGWKLTSILAEYEVNQRFDHNIFGLKPKYRMLSQHPTLHDSLHGSFVNGKIILKSAVKKLTEGGVIFEDQDDKDAITPVDLIVLATGYYITFPFLKSSFADPLNNEVPLYKFVFPPEMEHPTLAFIGLVQPIGAIFPISESQCRWFSQIMAGRLKLPEKTVMLKYIERTKKRRRERFAQSAKNTLEVDHIAYLDEIADELRAKPNLLKYFFTDQELFWSCLLNPCVAYQYRLEGSKPWAGARQAIVEYRERITFPFRGRKQTGRHHLYDILLNPVFLFVFITPCFAISIIFLILLTIHFFLYV